MTVQNQRPGDSVRKDIALFCYAYVSNQFAAMSNPGYRGKNFRWEEFPDRVSKRVENDIVVQRGIVGKGYEKEEILKLTKLAAEYSRDIATTLVSFLTY